MKQIEGYGRGVEVGWNPTYDFASGPSMRESRRANKHVLSVCMTVDSYPETGEGQRALVRDRGKQLVQEWVDRGLPLGELYYLVHRPNEFGPSEAQRVHRSDQAVALASDLGGVPVVLALTNVHPGNGLVVSRVRFD